MRRRTSSACRLRWLGPVLMFAAVGPRLVAGPCPEAGRVVQGLRFANRSLAGWDGPASAVGYNVYFQDGLAAPPPAFVGRCLYWSFAESATRLDGAPPPNGLWMFQITALFDGGEGPLAVTHDCTPVPPPAPCTCTLPAEVGPCDAVIPRWFHNYRSGACELFIWGGCGGNANNFETEAACTGACLAPCTRPAEVGPCDAAIPRWYFSTLSGRCEPFVWGGCGGNANNFETEADCRAACGP